MELDKLLAGNVLYMAIAKDGSEQYNQQSCDCREVIIVMEDRVLLAVHEKHGEFGTIRLDTIPDYDGEKYNMRINAPSAGPFTFIKVLYQEDGAIDAIKYRYDDRYLFIFSGEYNLVVTKSIPDLTEEYDTPIPDIEDSILFD